MAYFSCIIYIHYRQIITFMKTFILKISALLCMSVSCFFFSKSAARFFQDDNMSFVSSLPAGAQAAETYDNQARALALFPSFENERGTQDRAVETGKPRVRGIIFSSMRPMAVIESGSGDQTLVREGDSFESWKIAAIRGKSVSLESVLDGSRIDLEMDIPNSAKPAVESRTGRFMEKYIVIDKKEVDYAASNITAIIKEGKTHAIPFYKGGKPCGFLLYDVREDSLVKKAGLRNGDIVQKLNGVQLSVSAISALAGMHEGVVRVDVLRDNEPYTLNYLIK